MDTKEASAPAGAPKPGVRVSLLIAAVLSAGWYAALVSYLWAQPVDARPVSLVVVVLALAVILIPTLAVILLMGALRGHGRRTLSWIPWVLLVAGVGLVPSFASGLGGWSGGWTLGCLGAVLGACVGAPCGWFVQRFHLEMLDKAKRGSHPPVKG